jgi:predicted anti-sigma-YlaC factor YlaD
MNNICKIIEDLLPLYIEGLVNEENNKLIEEHLLTCDKCKSIYDEMKRDLIVEAPDTKLQKIEDKALAITKNIFKYQNILKLSLCSIMIVFAVIMFSVPITFINVFGLIVLTPFISRLLYDRSMPLILVMFICAIIGGIIVTGSITESYVIVLAEFLLMTVGIFSGFICAKAIKEKGNRVKRFILMFFSLIILAFGLYINSDVSGTPIGYVKAHNKISSYVKEKYPTGDAKITAITYDWYEKKYCAKISKGSGKELFTINSYRSGRIVNNYDMDSVNSYSDNYAKMVKGVLTYKLNGEYFWVIAHGKKDSNIKLDEFIATKDMDLIIRFTESNNNNPPLKAMSQDKFIELTKNAVKELDNLNLSYNDINFQALDEDKKEMLLDFSKGLNKENIWKAKN